MTSPGRKTIVIDYSPHSHQERVHDSQKRFRVLVCGRRWGKTTLAVNEMIKAALTKNGAKVWYVCPTYRQAKMVAFNLVKKYLPKEFIDKINLSDLTFFLKNGSEISLKGAEDYEALKGVGLDFVVLDEFATMNKMAWFESIRPTLSDTQGKALFIGTPKGRNHFFDVYTKNEPDYESFRYATADNPYIPNEEIDYARKDLSERLFKQEYLAEFLDDETGVFKGVRRCLTGTLAGPVQGRFYVIGVDLAKTEDFTVLTVIDSVTRGVVAFERFQEISWREQKIRIQDLARKYNNALCMVDSTGVGDPVFEDLQMSGVSAEGYKFSNDSKVKLIEQLSIAIEQRQITFPIDLEVLRDELMNYEYSFTNNGRIKYSAPEGKHDDCVISLALAVWGIRFQLREAQVVQDNEVLFLAQDKQGQGELVTAGEEEYQICGY